MNVSKLNLIVTGFILLQLVVACSQTNNTNTKTEEKPTTATIEQQQPSQAATAPVPDSTYTDEDGNDVAKFSDYKDAADHSIKDMPRTTLTVVGGNEYDFGKHKAGKELTHVFKIKNTGNEPLVISSARPSCGCTVPTFSTDPIEPGKHGEVKIAFDTYSRDGMQVKTIRLNTNATDNPTTLTIKADLE